jgi:tetratricopeptide (TPR) repeat protein
VLAFAEARLPEDSRAEVEAHARACPSCHELVDAAVKLAELERTAATNRLRRVIAARAETAELGPSDSDEPPPLRQEPLNPGAAIGHYTILALVGRGGMGEVYAAYDPKLDRRVALKVIHAEAAARDRHARERLLREAQVTAKLSHPNVIVVHDVGVFEGQVFLAMEFVEGLTLAEWLVERRRTWREILEVYIQAARGLAAAHAAGLVHRDFKPENVMVASDGSVRVTDFGLARRIGQNDSVPDLDPEDASLVDSSLTRTGTILGTPLYMAPEQFSAGQLDARTDQFSFCVALYWALFRIHPFGGPSRNAGAASVPLRKGKDAAPPWVQRVILRGLSRDPTARWSSMNDLAETLSRDPVKRRRVVGAAAAVAAACIAIGIASMRVVDARSSPCGEGAARLAGVWELGGAGSDRGSRREAVRAAIIRAGGADAAQIWERLATVLDQRASEWLAASRDSCEATNIRHDQSPELMDLRTQCLNDSLDATRALTDLLARGEPAVVGRSVEVVSSLDDLQRCADVRQLRLGPPLPTDPEVRRRVEELRVSLRDADRLFQFSEFRRASAIAESVRAAAAPLHYCPLDAEAMVLAGESEWPANPEAGQALVEEALERAESCGHDRMVARAAVELVWTYALRNPHMSERAASLARGVIARLGGDSRLEGWLANNMTFMLTEQGRFAEAKAVAEQSVEIKRRALGPDHLDTAISMNNVAMTLLKLGQPREALELIDRTIAIQLRWVGSRSEVIWNSYATRADVLFALGRYDEAESEYRRTLDTPVVDQRDHAYSLRGLGKTLTVRGRPKEAVPLLEAALRADAGDSPFEIADTEFALAEARDAASPRDLVALRLARQAAEAYATTPNFERERREIGAWLAARSASKSRTTAR